MKSLRTALVAPILSLSILAYAGGESGGGGFGDRSSMFILGRAQASLLLMLKNTSEEVFKGLPPNTRARLIKGVKSIESQPNVSSYRDQRELMFDYQDGPNGGKIIATKLFFQSHSHLPVVNNTPEGLNPYLAEVRLLILHEAAHLIGIGTTDNSDHKARGFAHELLRKMSQNGLLCFSDKQSNADVDRYHDIGERFSDSNDGYKLAIWISRSTGIMEIANFDPEQDKYPWVYDRLQQKLEMAEFNTAYIGDTFYLSGFGQYKSSTRTQNQNGEEIFSINLVAQDLSGTRYVLHNKNEIDGFREAVEELVVQPTMAPDPGLIRRAMLTYRVQYRDDYMPVAGQFALECWELERSFDQYGAEAYGKKFLRDGY